MTASKEFQFNQETEWNDVGAGLQRQMFGYDDRVLLVKVKFEKGGVGPLDAHLN